jgi:hypothetical protein
VQSYGKIKGKGVFGARGMQRVEYEIDTATSTSLEQFTSAVVLGKKQTQDFDA